MTGYKSSFYNLCYKIEGSNLIWIIGNSYSGCIIKADDELKEIIINFNQERFEKLRTDNSDVCDYLLDKGFIVDRSLNELERLRIRFWEAKFNNKNIHLTILPTNECNLACVYCYEEPGKQRFTPAIVDKVKKFVDDRISSLATLSVTWYGGEPLLEFWAVEELSHYFSQLCDKNDVKYSASMVSNGTLLDNGKVDALVSGGVKRIQITIDGPEDVHNIRRFYRNGKKPSFDDIIAGVASCKGKIPVGIRINVDRNNANRFKELIDYLFSKSLLGADSGNSVSLGIVKHWTDKVRINQKQLLPLSVFNDLRKELREYLCRCSINKTSKTSYNFIPSTPCAAVNVGNFLISPDGTLKKCWVQATEKSNIGSLEEGIDFSCGSTVKWIAYDPTLDECCQNCSLLPICVGGCPYEMMFKPKTKAEFCEYKRHSIKQDLLSAAKNKTKERR